VELKTTACTNISDSLHFHQQRLNVKSKSPQSLAQSAASKSFLPNPSNNQSCNDRIYFERYNSIPSKLRYFYVHIGIKKHRGQIMSTQFFVGICFVLGTLVAWNSWTLHQVNKRLDRIESTEAAQSSPKDSKLKENSRSSYKKQSRTNTSDSLQGRKYKQSSNKRQQQNNEGSQNSIDLSDPNIREAIAKIAQDDAQRKETQRRKSKMEAYKTSIQHELEKFSTEKGYDEDTTKKVEAILDERTNEWVAIRQQVREGEISWLDARTEFKAIGDETQSQVTEIISEEDYKELRSRLWGQWE